MQMLTRLNARSTNLLDNSYFQYGLLLAITLLGAILRLYKLGEWSFWFDEIFTVNRAQIHYGTLDAVISNIPPARNWLPLSIILTAGVLDKLGVNEWSARLIPVLVGVISIPILYLPAKRLFGWRAAMVAALLLAVSPWHIYWSQNARYFTSLLLFYSLALFAIYIWLEKDQFIYLLFFLVLLYLATSERIYALFIVPVIACYLLLLWLLPIDKPPGYRKRNLLILIVPFIVVVLFEGYNYIKLGSFRFLGDYSWFLRYRVDDPFRLLSFITFNIGIPLMVIAFFSGVYLILRKNRAGLLFFLGAIVPVFLLLIMNPFIFTKDRYVFLTLTSWIILGAVAIKEIFSQTKGYTKVIALGILFVFIADTAGANLMYYSVNNGNRRDWKQAFNLVKQRSNQGDLFVSYWPEFGPVYLKEDIISWEEIDPKTVEESGKRYWFVLDSETIWTNGRMKAWVEQNSELVEVKYLRTPEDLYLRVYLYDPMINSP
jgi:4-amino-4-deoxy-L-arabinose transferase-like glycosyltransferase